MKTYLAFDCETTGLINFSLDLLDPAQPRIVQLAAQLLAENGEIIEELNEVIKPDGWIIPDEAAKIHGITTARAEAEGVPMREVLEKFNSMKAKCTTRLAFNISFDKKMLAREEGAYGIEHTNSADIESICVMQLARPYCNQSPTNKMMAAGIRKNKPPKLSEAYEHFFGKQFENAHTAMGDVTAMMEIFFRIRELEKAAA